MNHPRELELYAEVFDPNVSDEEYFELRRRHHGILHSVLIMDDLLGCATMMREAIHAAQIAPLLELAMINPASEPMCISWDLDNGKTPGVRIFGNHSNSRAKKRKRQIARASRKRNR